MTEIAIPRPEHPRPQMVRDMWLSLNGEWEFEIDQGDSGHERGLVERPLRERITVPFCPESALSRVHVSDHLNTVWYRRTLHVPQSWAGQHALLHFQAVDQDATVWVDGTERARHRGGSTPFSVDLGAEAAGRDVTLVIRARDDHRSVQPQGKQSPAYEPSGCLYPRTTGIWQTVWVEAVPAVRLLRPRITPQLGTASILLEQPLTQNRRGWTIHARLSDAAGTVAEAVMETGIDLAPLCLLQIPPERARAWSPTDPHLYDLEITLRDELEEIVDRVRSYAGLRSVARDGNRMLLNGQVLFQRLVLDQGYWPESLLTAPADAELENDIRRGLNAGFNGARLHQKVVEERYLFHADRLGYLVWGEFCDWGVHGDEPTPTFITQWLEVLQRDQAHPCIVGWCPLNETEPETRDQISVLDDVTRGMFLGAKLADGSRPVLDTSGFSHRIREADVYDSHDYEQDPETFRENHRRAVSGVQRVDDPDGGMRSVGYEGQPYLVSEFGGARLSLDGDGWGYGDEPAGPDAFVKRFDDLCDSLLSNPGVAGYCYTQLTDVFQEQNGLYTLDRRPKVDVDRLAAAQRRLAAIEHE